MAYNLGSEDKKIVDMALTLLGQTYDQHGFKNPKDIFWLRDKIKKCSNVQLQTYSGKRTFADEA